MKSILCFMSLILITAQGFAQVAIHDPMDYSQAQSKARAFEDSDTHRYFLDGCQVIEDQNPNVKILCSGTIEVLVFGGHRASRTFEYEYTFKRQAVGGYILIKAE